MSNLDPHEIPRRGELRELILEVLITTKLRDPFEEGLRPSEIKRAIVNIMLLKLNRDELLNLGTRLDRSLRDNIKDGFITKDDKGHRKVFYKLIRKEFPDYEFITDTHIDFELPPIFGLYGLFKKSNNFDEFRKAFQKYLMDELQEKLADMWKQHQLVSKYYFTDLLSVREILDNDESTFEEKKEIIEFSNLMFEFQLYRRNILRLHGKEVVTINQKNIEPKTQHASRL